MVKIYHRPDPPPPDVDSNRAVRKTDTFLNREASAGLFQRALVKAQGQEQAVQRSTLADSGLQQQVESDAHSVLGTKVKENSLATQSETSVGNHQAAALNAVEAEANKMVEAEDGVELEEPPEDSTDVDSVDQADQPDLDSGFVGSATGLDSSAAYQLFDNIQQQNNLTEPEPNADTSAMSEGVNSAQDTTESAQNVVANSAATTAASMQSRIDTVSGLSDLIDMLETSSQLPAGNEWTLILEDDGPVSELTLSSDPDGRWHIDLLTSFDNNAVDENVMGHLRNQLDAAGIAVANIELVDRASVDNALTENTLVNQEPTDLSSAKRTIAKDSGTNNSV